MDNAEAADDCFVSADEFSKRLGVLRTLSVSEGERIQSQTPQLWLMQSDTIGSALIDSSKIGVKAHPVSRTRAGSTRVLAQLQGAPTVPADSIGAKVMNSNWPLHTE